MLDIQKTFLNQIKDRVKNNFLHNPNSSYKGNLQICDPIKDKKKPLYYLQVRITGFNPLLHYEFVFVKNSLKLNLQIHGEGSAVKHNFYENPNILKKGHNQYEWKSRYGKKLIHSIDYPIDFSISNSNKSVLIEKSVNDFIQMYDYFNGKLMTPSVSRLFLI